MIPTNIRNIFEIKKGTDAAGTIESVRNDIYLKGSNFWYLVCSTILASIGLDTNSPAIIIGAMLISPLMYPILGVGLSIGIHDRETFTASIREFFYFILVSIIISTLYFILTPLGNPTNEIIARTKPTLLDVMVAIFGGIAGIVAGSRSKVTSAIPGVAIATALMPPLCVSGFGLATGNMEYFFGSFYLFFINGVFIAFSSYIVVRYLKFPIKEYLDRKSKLRMRYIMLGLIVIFAVPSIYIFYNVIIEARYNRNTDRYLKAAFSSDSTRVLDWRYDKDSTGDRVLKIFIIGKELSENTQDSLARLTDTFGIGHTKVDFVYPRDFKGYQMLRTELKTEMMRLSEVSKNSRQELLTALDSSLRKSDSLRYSDYTSGLRALYPEIQGIAISKRVYEQGVFNDTAAVKDISVIEIKWSGQGIKFNTAAFRSKLYEFSKASLNKDTLIIINSR